MVQKSDVVYQREEIIGWKFPLVPMLLEFHTGVSNLKFQRD